MITCGSIITLGVLDNEPNVVCNKPATWSVTFTFELTENFTLYMCTEHKLRVQAKEARMRHYFRDVGLDVEISYTSFQ